MYFRLKQTPSGQCLQLLEAYRNAEGSPRQRVVVSLGDAPIPEAERSAIARAVEQTLQGQPSLLPEPLSAAAQEWIDTILKRIEREGRYRKPASSQATPASASVASQEAAVIDGVLVNEVSHTHTSPLGPSLVGWEAWKRLQMPQLLEELGFNQSQAEAAAITVIHRLASPGSERALMEWLPDSALPELLGMEQTQGIKDRFYRISDQLLKRQSEIQKHLQRRQGEIFPKDRTILLYDLTNSYFEGEALGNAKAQRGRSKEKRNDCPLVVVGMVFDQRGCELAHKVFAGNQSDSKSLVSMIGELEGMIDKEQLPGLTEKPLVIMDAGVATRENLKLLRQKGFDYLVNDSRRGRLRYQEEFLKKAEFEQVGQREGKTPVWVRQLKDPHPPEEAADDSDSQSASSHKAGGDSKKEREEPDYLILCRSEGRAQKERAIRSEVESKYLKSLEKLARRVASGKLQDAVKIQRAIGRLERGRVRVKRFYEVVFKPGEAGQKTSLTWSRKEESYAADDSVQGCYVLRANRPWPAGQQGWRLYTTLTQAEAGFRAIKGDLGLRPNFHQIEPRVDGHVFISVLAYHLLWLILQSLEAVQDTRSWQTIRAILQTHAYTTILLPTKGGKLYRLRRPGEPDQTQKTIYETLQINWKNLPQSKVVVENNNAATL
jgi:transposase